MSMKWESFSSKDRAMWMTIATFAVPVLAVIAYLILTLVRYLRA